MSTLNIDAMVDPIEVIIDGQGYTVAKLTEAKMNEIMAIGKNNDVGTLAGQLGMILGVEPEIFRDTDVRILGHAINGIMGEITGGLDVDTKNV